MLRDTRREYIAGSDAKFIFSKILFVSHFDSPDFLKPILIQPILRISFGIQINGKLNEEELYLSLSLRLILPQPC